MDRGSKPTAAVPSGDAASWLERAAPRTEPRTCVALCVGPVAGERVLIEAEIVPRAELRIELGELRLAGGDTRLTGRPFGGDG